MIQYKPIQLNMGQPPLTISTVFEEKLLSAYELMPAQITPKELLLLTTSPPELPEDLGGMTTVAVNTNQTNYHELSLHIVNNVVNRLLLSQENGFTYQDSVYLTMALHKLGVSTYLLDGDNVRHGLCSDLGFSDADRKENIRRVGEVANLMVEAGLVVLTAFISPHRAERQMVRERVGEGRFIEVFVDTPLAICEARDPKGLYKKARAGELRYFTGIDSVYEAPESAEIHLNGEQLVTNLVQQLLDLLRQNDIIRS